MSHDMLSQRRFEAFGETVFKNSENMYINLVSMWPNNSIFRGAFSSVLSDLSVYTSKKSSVTFGLLSLITFAAIKRWRWCWTTFQKHAVARNAPGRFMPLRPVTAVPKLWDRNRKCQYNGRYWHGAAHGQSRFSKPQKAS